MKANKFLTILFLMFVSITFFCGCASVEFIRAVDASNTIMDKIAISLDESKVNKSGLNLETIMNSIEDDMNKFRNEVNAWKSEQFAEYPELFETVKTGIKVEVTKPRRNEISLALEFDGWNMFGLFYGYAEAEDFEYTKFVEDKGPFINNILNSNYEDNSYGLFLIKYSILKSNGIVGNIKSFEFDGTNYYDKYYNMFMHRYNLDDVDISQIFAFPDDRLHSNADDIEVEGDLTLLKWNMNGKNEDYQMTIYKITANPSTWYIVALVISAISVIIITVVIRKKSKGQIVQIIEKKDLEN